MNTRHTVIFASLMMLFSSMAGCLDRSDDDDEVLGTAMVSTSTLANWSQRLAGTLSAWR